MNVYVASSFKNKDAVRKVFGALYASGHTVAHDWTALNADGMYGYTLEVFLETCGKNDYFGVMRADAVILLAHEDMKDALAEMGVALGAGKPVIVVDAERKHSVFYGLCKRVGSVAEAIKALEES
jgi:hypothetical protein